METGIELIAKERKEQLQKHGYSTGNDVYYNKDGQLRRAAEVLLSFDGPRGLERRMPKNWTASLWKKMISKGQRERLIIAGALIAAELDRLRRVRGLKFFIFSAHMKLQRTELSIAHRGLLYVRLPHVRLGQDYVGLDIAIA